MSIFKTLAVVAGVAAVSYAAYRVAKANPEAVSVAIKVLATPAPCTYETVEVIEIEEDVFFAGDVPSVTIVHETVEIEASEGEGVMSVASAVQNLDDTITVTTDGVDVEVISTRAQPKLLKPITFEEGHHKFKHAF